MKDEQLGTTEPDRQPWSRERLLEAVQRGMPAKRWAHTLGVMKSAVELADRFGGDAAKADLAALLHDYCKYWPVEEQRRVVVENGLPADVLDYGKPLLHAPTAAFIAARDFGIDDEEVLDAVRYHTSGRPGMTLLDKIVCLADYIEPGRDFPGVDRLRELAQTSLERALLAGFDGTIIQLIEIGEKVYPLSLQARNSLVDELRKKEGRL